MVESTFRGSGICKWLDTPLGDERAASNWINEAEQNRGPPVWIEGQPKPPPPFTAIAAATELVRAAK